MMRDPWEPLSERQRYRYQVHRFPSERELARQERAETIRTVAAGILSGLAVIVAVGVILAGWGQS